MGIKHLHMLLKHTCNESGIYYFPTVTSYLKSEKMRRFKEEVRTKVITNPVKQMQLKRSIEEKPYFIGIDAYLYASRYKRVFKKIEYGFLKQIMLSLSSKMIPIYVFDGNAPEQKRYTIEQRQNKKRRVREKLEELLVNSYSQYYDMLHMGDLTFDELMNHIKQLQIPGAFKDDDGMEPNLVANHLLYNSTKECDENTLEMYDEIKRLSKKSISVEYDDIRNLKNFLDLLKIPYVTATEEADDLMALLYKKGIINACQSDDMDMLPKGCGNIIQISSDGVCQFILNEILECLDLTHNQFVDLCILLGSDYYKIYLPKMKAIDLYNTFKLTPSIEDFVLIYSKIDSKIMLHLESYQNTRKSFLLSTEDFDKKLLTIKLGLFDFDTIKNYFDKIGITLDSANKIKSMIRPINQFILMLKQSSP